MMNESIPLVNLAFLIEPSQKRPHARSFPSLKPQRHEENLKCNFVFSFGLRIWEQN
jgi:hypothetical protein